MFWRFYIHFITRWEGTGIFQGGSCSAQMQKVYDDANITLRFQDNKQNCRRIESDMNVLSF